MLHRVFGSGTDVPVDHFGICEIVREHALFSKDMFPPISPRFEKSKRFSLSRDMANQFNFPREFQRFSLGEPTELTVWTPLPPSTRIATALAQAIFPQVWEGGRKIGGPAKLEPKW